MTGRVRVAGARFLLGVVLWSGGLVACRGEKPVETAGPELLALDADQVIVGMEHYMTREGLRRAHLLSDTAYFLSDSSRVRLVPVDVTFFDDEGREVSELVARRGLYDMRTNDMRAEGRVVVRSRGEFRRLETERLTYSASEDSLRSDTTFVLYRDDGVTIRGTAFVSDPSLRRFRVVRPSAVVESREER